MSTADMLSVLVVDDSSLMRRRVMDIVSAAPMLRIAGEASNGAEALAQLATLDPDIILLDIEMPVMDGLTFLKLARFRTDARILVLSSIARPGSPTAAEALALGAHDALPKPSGVISLDLADAHGNQLVSAMRNILAPWQQWRCSSAGSPAHE